MRQSQALQGYQELSTVWSHAAPAAPSPILPFASQPLDRAVDSSEVPRSYPHNRAPRPKSTCCPCLSFLQRWVRELTGGGGIVLHPGADVPRQLNSVCAPSMARGPGLEWGHGTEQGHGTVRGSSPPQERRCPGSPIPTLQPPTPQHCPTPHHPGLGAANGRDAPCAPGTSRTH